MKYKLAFWLIALITLFVFWEHLIRGISLMSSDNQDRSILLIVYNFAVSIVIFLFAAGYTKKLEEHIEKYDKGKKFAKAKKREHEAMEMVKRSLKKDQSL